MNLGLRIKVVKYVFMDGFLSCELVVFLSEVAVSAFAAAGFFWVVCLVFGVAFPADVNVSE